MNLFCLHNNICNKYFLKIEENIKTIHDET